jgi:hypothetical protein
MPGSTAGQQVLEAIGRLPADATPADAEDATVDAGASAGTAGA